MSNTNHAVAQRREVRVPFLDLQAQYAELKAELLPEILQSLDRAVYIDGPAVRQFEEQFAAYCESEYCVALDSGTAALHLALLALDIKAGDEVLLPANTFVATAAAVAMTGATVVPVDSDRNTWLMDLNRLEDKITSRTRAVIAVHLYGVPLQMDSLAEICGRRNLHLIEDAAQAHGARYCGRRVGRLGRLACFSFYPGKNLGAYGDAGAITTDDRQLAERIRSLSNHGRGASKYDHMEVGYNYRMDELQAIVLKRKLRELDGWNAKRRSVAQEYRHLLSLLPLRLYQVSEECEAVYHLFTICCDRNQDLAKHLKACNIDTGFHYPVPIHLQPAFKSLGFTVGDLPVAEQIAAQTLSLPIFPEMTVVQVASVCSAIKDFYA